MQSQGSQAKDLKPRLSCERSNAKESSFAMKTKRFDYLVRPGVYKIAQGVSAHFCRVKTPSIEIWEKNTFHVNPFFPVFIIGVLGCNTKDVKLRAARWWRSLGHKLAVRQGAAGLRP